MDLDVVGRHALLFDDDAMAIFVNSADALVEWNSLYIDRYDVRHLLSAPPPQPKRSLHSLSHAIDSSLKLELDLERYLDLPPSDDDPEKDEENTAQLLNNTGGYHAIPFSYGNASGIAEEVNPEIGVETSAFRPSFYVPEHLLQCLPPSEKVHQIIARTAQFVSRHGGQSEIVLRVKQGDNPTFGFLMPDHHLHPYYRYLVDHQELLDSDGDRIPQYEERKVVAEPDGALSLLGTVYGSGEDDDGLIEDVSNKMSSNEAVDAAPIPQEKDKSSESSATVLRQEIVLSHPVNSGGSDKEKSQLLKENPSISGSKNGGTGHKKVKDDSISASIQAALEKLKASGLGVKIKTEPVVLEPPSDLKKLIGRIVEFILKNGKQFEATLVEQDSKHGRFPFLLPSNMYHPYYLKVLHDSQESKVSGQSFPSGRDDSIGRQQEKRASLSKGADALACGSGDGDLPCENDRKEKFKMVIGKSKKEPQEQLDKVPQQENGFNLDAASVAAILQAAARGIKNPNIGMFSKTDVNAKSNAEANSSESQLSKEQILKAERRKKAKMFVAMLKNKAPPFKSEPSREVSLEPQDSGNLNDNKSDQDGRLKFIDEYNEKRSMRNYRSRSGIDEEDEDGVEREHRSAGTDHKSLMSPMVDEKGEENEDAKDHKRSKRKKHHRSHESSEDEASDLYEEERRGHRHSSKKHRSHNKHDDDNDDRHSRKKHRSHNKHDDGVDDRQFRKKHQSHNKHDDDDDDDRHSRKKHLSHNKHDDDDDVDDDDYDYDRHPRKKQRSHNKHDGDDGEGKYHRHSRKKHRSHHSSHHRSRHERPKRGSSIVEGEDLEEGEISGGGKVSDQSKGSLGGAAITRSREASIDVSTPQQRPAFQPPDDLKAKIRAMLIETRR